jgi:hypothetical protein
VTALTTRSAHPNTSSLPVIEWATRSDLWIPDARYACPHKAQRQKVLVVTEHPVSDFSIVLCGQNHASSVKRRGVFSPSGASPPTDPQPRRTHRSSDTRKCFLGAEEVLPQVMYLDSLSGTRPERG